MKFTEVAIFGLLGVKSYPHVLGEGGLYPQESLALRSQVASKPCEFGSNTRAH